MTYIARREFLSSLLFASIQSIMPASMQGTSSTKSSAPVLDKHDFEPVRRRILKEIAGGAATGVAVAVAHNGKIVWEEGFGWADKWRPKYEDMACYRFARDNADSRFKRFGAYKSHQGDDQIPDEKRALIEKDATALVETFLGGLGEDAKFYHCQWDNNDDTGSEALVSIDGTEARVIVGWQGG